MIYSSELNGMTQKLKISKVISYIEDNEYWERCYVLMNFLHWLRVLHLVDINQEGMDKIYYYSIMMKMYIQNSISELYN